MKRLVLLVTAICFLYVQGAEAQRLLERGMIVNPFIEEANPVEEGTTSWMHHWGGWVGFSRYGVVRDEAHLWLHQLGGFIEMARFGPSASLLITSQIEFVADPHNEINFNPRSIFWEEGLLYTHRLGSIDLQGGVYYRCKHEVDNLQFGEERSLIFGSFTTRAIMNHPGWDAALKADLYAVRQDFRLPEVTRGVGLNWNKLLASTEAVLRGEQSLGDGGWHVYAGSHVGLSLFSGSEDFLEGLTQPSELRASGGVTAGVALRGEGGELRFNIDYEYLPDTGIRPIPRDAHLLRFGLLAVDPFSVR